MRVDCRYIDDIENYVPSADSAEDVDISTFGSHVPPANRRLNMAKKYWTANE
jgi:hypothetical protein